MKSINEIKKDYTPTKPQTRRDLISKFYSTVNDYMKAEGFKPYAYSFFVMKLKHLDDWDVKIFYGNCCEARNFVSYFFWALDPKKHIH